MAPPRYHGHRQHTRRGARRTRATRVACSPLRPCAPSVACLHCQQSHQRPPPQLASHLQAHGCSAGRCGRRDAAVGARYDRAAAPAASATGGGVALASEEHWRKALQTEPDRHDRMVLDAVVAAAGTSRPDGGASVPDPSPAGGLAWRALTVARRRREETPPWWAGAQQVVRVLHAGWGDQRGIGVARQNTV